MQPLSDLLVLDFTTLLPGPLASLMLAEAGAEVVKVERPGFRLFERTPDGLACLPGKLRGLSSRLQLASQGRQGCAQLVGSVGCKTADMLECTLEPPDHPVQ